MDHRRVSMRIRGIVQGVGFRPYIFKLAHKHGLSGWVRNQSDGVELEIAGHARAVEAFVGEVPVSIPPLARVVSCEAQELPYSAMMEGFAIIESRSQDARSTLISPDVRTCDDCLRELLDPEDRRFRYPFINCTNCGPRYTIIQDIPYDRSKTVMSAFPLCSFCRAEYEDPLDRRFHAQPNACRDCGPQVWLEGHDGRRLAERDVAVRRVIELMDSGAIVAVKGLGGFHLAVSAVDERGVRRLRERKIREEKPFAVMFREVSSVESACELGDAERALLVSAARPIVLLRKKDPFDTFPIAPSVAPGNRWLGAFLPYTPLHHLLFVDASYDALVMTSGNRSDEPIVMTNDDARERLGSITDYFLLHDRDIHMRCDDSVARIHNGRPAFLRRARGYVPVPMFMRGEMPPVLGVGAEVKSTVCLTRGNEAFLSQHVGDLSNLETLKSFEHTIAHLKQLLSIEPQCIVHDLHPDYLSTQWALKQSGVPVLAVQHHHAHIASVVAEHRLEGPILGLALDGTGYGSDGTIWGGELLWVEGHRFRRLGHLRQVRMPGGQAAVKEPWRMALSYLHEISGGRADEAFPRVTKRWPLAETRPLSQMIHKGIHSPLTSSCGRLFDAVSALLGVRESISYEGQAAIELEQAIEPDSGLYAGALKRKGNSWLVDTFPAILELLRDMEGGTPVGVISARFHNGVAGMLEDLVMAVVRETGIHKVALSGGVFQNVYFLERLTRALVDRGMDVHGHGQVPPNDACIALGQAYVGGLWLSSRS